MQNPTSYKTQSPDTTTDSSILRATVSAHSSSLRHIIYSMLLLFSVLCNGCYDPQTQSQVTNATSKTIEMECVLDQTQWKHGFEPEDYQKWLAERSEEWIRQELVKYAAQSEGVELSTVNAPHFSGTFHIAPSGFMVLYDGMGSQPVTPFSQLRIKTDQGTTTLTSPKKILEMLKVSKENPRLYEWVIQQLD